MPKQTNPSELLMFISGYVHRLLHHEARRLGIRWMALMVLKDLDLLGPSSQQTLADIEQVRKPTMTVLLQQMEEQGWIRRNVDADDARLNVVKMTPKGARELQTTARHLRKRLDAALEGLPEWSLLDLQCGLGPVAAMWMAQICESNASKDP